MAAEAKEEPEADEPVKKMKKVTYAKRKGSSVVTGHDKKRQRTVSRKKGVVNSKGHKGRSNGAAAVHKDDR
jgi:hypothetical protein